MQDANITQLMATTVAFSLLTTSVGNISNSFWRKSSPHRNVKCYERSDGYSQKYQHQPDPRFQKVNAYRVLEFSSLAAGYKEEPYER